MAEPAFTVDAATAAALDEADPLAPMRARFDIPRTADGDEQVYLAGNSLGAQPRAARDAVLTELDRWARSGVAGHFDGELAWAPYHELLAEPIAAIVGAGSDEVVVMNSLTVNLHLMMVSFYRPTATRHKVLIEEHAFPSDHFAVESQIRQRGLDPVSSMVMVGPRDGEDVLRTEDLVAAIDEIGPELALVMLPGVQYYTGQVLDLPTLTAAAHEVGAHIGFNLAHSAGNVITSLHDWDVDFAVWCSYKYLNSGPGGVGGAFVHRRHHTDQDRPKLLGWWGTAKSTRFQMSTRFDPIPTVESWQLSNAPILAMAALRASLDVFESAGGMGPLRAKSERQIRYLDYLLAEVLGDRVELVTPSSLPERGCQFSLRARAADLDGDRIDRQLEAAGVACDWRYPEVFRAAPTPLYNSFGDIHRFVTVLDRILR